MDVRVLCLLFGWALRKAAPYSIDKQLLEAASTPEMFDFFHVMPDGMVKVVHDLDMLLSLDQYKELYRNETKVRKKRKADIDLAKRWKNCFVYYEIMEGLSDPKDRAIIREAMYEFEKYTCLHFVESSTEENRIQFKDGKMCLSAVGMQGGIQVLELAPACRTKGLILHEIGHAIGWFHEHARPDRDEFVRVNLNAIPDDFHPEYTKYGADVINTYNVPYDYTSIMHYGQIFDGSITTNDPNYQDKIGLGKGLSFKDIKVANLMYNCAKVMGCSTDIDCGEGFLFYKNFKNQGRCKCWCDSKNISDPLVLCSGMRTTKPPPATFPPPTLDPAIECKDVPMIPCAKHKDEGLCRSRLTLMMRHCPETCDFCAKGDDLCMDYEPGCSLMAGFAHEPGLQARMSEICRATVGLCPRPPDPCEIQKEMFGDPYEVLADQRKQPHENNVAMVITPSMAVITAIVLFMFRQGCLQNFG